MGEPSSERYLDIPRIVMPIQLPGAAAQPPDDFSRAANPNTFDPADADDCSHRFPYVMRSKQFGSAQPADETDPLALSEANPDTWDKDAPQPLRKPVAISLITVADAPEVATTVPHGIPIGKTALVKFSATNSVPKIDGVRVVKALTATTVSVLAGPATEELGNTGKMALVCDGVTYDATPRIYKAAGVTKKFARQVKYDSCGELYYIGPEVEIESCSSSNPYLMRSRLYGSTQPSDTTNPKLSGEANTDTWDRSSPPIYNLVATDGVTYDPVPRIYKDTVAGVTKIFTRQVKYDSCGELYYIGIEVETEITGSGGPAPSCTSSSPYTMRSLRHGSAQPSDLTTPLDLNTANPDTWDRANQPRYKDSVTIGTLPRFYAYPNGSSLYYKVFDRVKKYNSCGELIYVGPEKLVFEMQTYGSIVTTAELP